MDSNFSKSQLPAMAALADMVDMAELKKFVIMALNWAMLAGTSRDGWGRAFGPQPLTMLPAPISTPEELPHEASTDKQHPEGEAAVGAGKTDWSHGSQAGSVVGLSETFVINDCIAGLLFAAQMHSQGDLMTMLPALDAHVSGVLQRAFWSSLYELGGERDSWHTERYRCDLRRDSRAV